MKILKNYFTAKALYKSMLFLLVFACAPIGEEPTPSEPIDSMSESGTRYLNFVGLYLDVGNNASGNLTIEIRSIDGSTIIGSKTVNATTLGTGYYWRTFYLASAVPIEPGDYRLYVTRSVTHNASNGNHIYWASSNGDTYFDGVARTSNDIPIEKDFGFRMYVDFVLEIDHSPISGGYALGLTPWIQEFKITPQGADYINTLHLLLDVDSNVTGNLIVELRNDNGTEVLATKTIDVTTLSPWTSWREINFGSQVEALPGKYRIYVMRTEPASLDKQITWKFSKLDLYPNGSSNASGDYAFKVFVDSNLEQSQTYFNYGYALSNSNYKYQEFDLN